MPRTALGITVLGLMLALPGTPSSYAYAHAAALSAHEFGVAKNTMLLLQLGFGPEALAAAGLNQTEVSAFVNSALNAIDSQASQIRASDERLAQAAAALKSPSAPLAELVEELESARAADETLRAQLVDSISAALSSSQRGRVLNIRSNKRWNLPVKYLVVNRTTEEWNSLRQALAAARDAQAHQKPVDSAVSSIISTAEASQETISAAAGLQNLASVRTAWTNAVSAE